MNSLHDILVAITGSLEYFLPEIAISAAILCLIFIGLFKGGRFEIIYRMVSLVAALLIFSLDIWQWCVMENSVVLFRNMIILDRTAAFWKFLFGIGTAITILMGFKNQAHKDKSSEYYALIFSLLLGAHLLAMAHNLLMVYLGIELLSISAFILTAFGFNKSSMESGMKYLLFGAAASGFMLYGMSWLYALTGTLNFAHPSFLESLMQAHIIPLTIAGMMVLGGILYKISAAPMHIWAPDVYTAAPTPIVAFFSVVPKLAGIAICMKWVLVINLYGLGSINWSAILAVVAMLTITIGNFSALWQNNVKRMLAYSSIAHSGFIIIGLVAFSETAYQAILFYAAIYLVMNMAVFLFIDMAERRFGCFLMEDFKGMATAYPAFAIAVVIIMISLTGIPPTAGFTAKLLVFSALWDSYSYSGNDWSFYLLIFALINTVVSLFYYLKLPYFMIFKSNIKYQAKRRFMFSFQNYLGFFLVVTILVLFFKPDVLMRIINNVSFAF